MPSDADYQAAAAAKNAADVPDFVLEGTPVGKCNDCHDYFEYGTGTGRGNLTPCPHCGSDDWEKIGYQHDGGIKRRSD